jgi:Spy/CpxP family protein refolding chaperone
MRPGDCPSPWRNPRILLILLLVFLCGSAVGALSMRYHIRVAAAERTSTWKEGNKEIALKTFVEELDLTEEQEKEVALILDDFTMYYQTLQAQMDEVRANGKERILQILDAEQQKKFHKMMTELQARQLR